MCIFLGCAELLCLVCLFDLACFFLSSFSSLIKNMYWRRKFNRSYIMCMYWRNGNVYILTTSPPPPPPHTVPRPAAPQGVSVSDVQPHSVRVSWEAVEGADMYTIRFRQTVGNEQQGQCASSHSGSVESVNGVTVVIIGEGDEMLRAFTTYSITVAAVSDVLAAVKTVNQ